MTWDIYVTSGKLIKEFLMRNGQPYSYMDLEQNPDVQNLLDSFQISASEIPVFICKGELVLPVQITKKLQTALTSMSLLNKLI